MAQARKEQFEMKGERNMKAVKVTIDEATLEKIVNEVNRRAEGFLYDGWYREDHIDEDMRDAKLYMMQGVYSAIVGLVENPTKDLASIWHKLDDIEENNQ